MYKLLVITNHLFIHTSTSLDISTSQVCFNNHLSTKRKMHKSLVTTNNHLKALIDLDNWMGQAYKTSTYGFS